MKKLEKIIENITERNLKIIRENFRRRKLKKKRIENFKDLNLVKNIIKMLI